jgi:hypothetical protein
MFFSDPVAAFANIRASLKPDARLAFVAITRQDKSSSAGDLRRPRRLRME